MDAPFSRFGLLAGLGFAVPAVALLFLLQDYYAEVFTLLVGWLVLYVLVLAWVRKRLRRRADRREETLASDDPD